MSLSVHDPVDLRIAEERYFEVGGVKLRFKESGRGPALVLVHGWTLSGPRCVGTAGVAAEWRISRHPNGSPRLRTVSATTLVSSE